AEDGVAIEHPVRSFPGHDEAEPLPGLAANEFIVVPAPDRCVEVLRLLLRLREFGVELAQLLLLAHVRTQRGRDEHEGHEEHDGEHQRSYGDLAWWARVLALHLRRRGALAARRGLRTTGLARRFRARPGSTRRGDSSGGAAAHSPILPHERAPATDLGPGVPSTCRYRLNNRENIKEEDSAG